MRILKPFDFRKFKALKNIKAVNLRYYISQNYKILIYILLNNH
jgi:hypothetical protein